MYRDLLEETPTPNQNNERTEEALAASAPTEDSHEAAASTALTQADADTIIGNATDTDDASDIEGEAATAIGESDDASTDDAEATEASDETTDTGDTGNAGDTDGEAATGSRETAAEASCLAEASDEAPITGNTDPVDDADLVDDVDVPQTPTAIAVTLRVELGAASELTVQNVEEVEATTPNARVDKRRALLRLQGLSDEAIDKILPVMAVTRKTQRQLPVDSTVCSPEMIAFFEGRDDATITGDCVKGIRNDGGPYGPAGMYERTLIKLGVEPGTAKTAGEVLAAKVNHRIVAIRVNVVATINELRRRRAVADGLNPRAEKYLRVR